MPSDAPNTRHRILDAFAEQYGPDGSADMSVVAAAAGVSRSTVYRHFADAGEMLEAARQEGLAAGARLVETHLAAALRGDADADLLRGVANLLQSVLIDGLPYARLLRLDVGADETIRSHYLALATEIIRKAQREGTIDVTLDPAALYVSCVSLCRGLISAVDEGTLDARSAAQISTRFFEALRPV